MSAPPRAPLVPSVDVDLRLVGNQVNITDRVRLGLNFTALNVMVDTLLQLKGKATLIGTYQTNVLTSFDFFLLPSALGGDNDLGRRHDQSWVLVRSVCSVKRQYIPTLDGKFVD